MKKRLLITSIVMMLVVAVALSTATYAWFTSNATVTANQVVLTAATMNEDAILISHAANNTGLSQEITLTAQGTDTLYPATPLANTAFTSTVSGETFKNLLVDGTNTAKNKVLGTNEVSYYTDTFYIYNKGFSAVTLVPTVSIAYGTTGAASDAAHSLRIALIEEVGSWSAGALTFSGTPTLKNIYEIDASTAVHQDPEDSESDITGYTATTKVALGSSTAGSGYGVVAAAGDAFTQGGVLFSTTAMSAIAAPASETYVANKYTVVIWLEGWDEQCTNAMSAGAANVSLSFTKAA